MAEKQIKQMMINDRLVGITGWEDAIKKIAAGHKGMAEKEIKEALIAEISRKNYIPPAALDDYGRALLREFKIVQGLPVAEEIPPGLHIAVLGMGCARCAELEGDVRSLLSEMKLAADLRHIADAKEIAGYGVLGSPALMINNKIVSVGEVPPKSKIRQWIIEACNPTDK